MADEQRMIAALVPRGHFGGDPTRSHARTRRVAGIFVFRIISFDRPAGEMADQSFLPTGETLHAAMSGLQQELVHARFLADRHDDDGGSSEPDMNALAVMPRISPRTCVVMTVTPVTNEAMTRRKTVSVTAPSAAAWDAASVVIAG